MPDILILVECVRMLLGIAGAANAGFGILGADLLDQLDRVLVVVGAGKIHSRRDISPECQDILNTGSLDLPDLVAHTVPCGADAGQMGHGSDSFRHDILRDLDGITAGPAAGSVSTADKGRVKAGDLTHAFPNRFELHIGFGRKNFHGNGDRLIPEYIADLHNKPPIQCADALSASLQYIIKVMKRLLFAKKRRLKLVYFVKKLTFTIVLKIKQLN